MLKEHKTPRGIRNNNPLNIKENERIDFDWEGEHLADLDKGMEEFSEAIYGYRAGARILKSYYARNDNSIEKIISNWAPKIENETAAYINHVSGVLGVDKSHYLEPEKWPELFAVMTKHENGYNPFNLEYIQRGIEMA